MAISLQNTKMAQVDENFFTFPQILSHFGCDPRRTNPRTEIEQQVTFMQFVRNTL